MRALFIEPFDVGSHASFRRSITAGVVADWTELTLPGRHWKWRMRGSAVWFAREHRAELELGHDLLFASSYLPLVELHGLVPATAQIPSVLYFHENQLAYPIRREHGGSNYQFGFTQLVSALAASAVVFNSEYNRSSFFEAAENLLKRMPDAVPASWLSEIQAKSLVLPLPLTLPDAAPDVLKNSELGPLILWNHRWEFDKNPELFCDALEAIAARGVPFRVAFCGQRFRQAPDCFERAREALGGRVVAFGHQPLEVYQSLLRRADIVASTAVHEFFGISIVEATHAGAMPLVPNRLAYRETVRAEFRYATDDEFEARLEALCARYQAGEVLRADRRSFVAQFSAAQVLPRYEALIEGLVASSPRP
ncbi:MAG: glycosyltransferase involved in cell wall biosynthesis [Bradymonadia bacterium]|jgi:glycosyltransferase involved in cell wall biosynthesis